MYKNEQILLSALWPMIEPTDYICVIEATPGGKAWDFEFEPQPIDHIEEDLVTFYGERQEWGVHAFKLRVCDQNGNIKLESGFTIEVPICDEPSDYEQHNVWHSGYGGVL